MALFINKFTNLKLKNMKTKIFLIVLTVAFVLAAAFTFNNSTNAVEGTKLLPSYLNVTVKNLNGVGTGPSRVKITNGGSTQTQDTLQAAPTFYGSRHAIRALHPPRECRR